jgi:ADP-ribose pyrophosphatase YjhB (NUDIX family)
MNPQWLDWARRLQATAQSGLAFTENPFERERYEEVQQIAAEMMAAGSNGDVDQLLDLFTDEAGYATPKIDVRGVVIEQNKILLVRERRDGRWTLPGGFADVGISPAENVVKEIREESGYQTRAIKLLAAYDRSKHPHGPYIYHIYKLFFLCELEGGEAQASIETSEVEFFAEDDLPSLSTPRVTEGQIRRMFEHYRNPEWPTDFD